MYDYLQYFQAYFTHCYVCEYWLVAIGLEKQACGLYLLNPPNKFDFSAACCFSNLFMDLFCAIEINILFIYCIGLYSVCSILFPTTTAFHLLLLGTAQLTDLEEPFVEKRRTLNVKCESITLQQNVLQRMHHERVRVIHMATVFTPLFFFPFMQF